MAGEHQNLTGPKKVIIIGSGVAGLACAIRLAHAGFAVKVYEKNGEPGGKIFLVERDGYRFDGGPSLFTEPQNIEDLFRLCNEDVRNYFSHKKLDLSCRYFFENGLVADASTDHERLNEEFKNKFGEKSTAVTEYLERAKKVYNNIGAVFLNHSLHKKSTWLSSEILNALRHTKAAYIFKSLHSVNNKNFSSKQVVQIFDRFATYNGSDPYQTPGMMSMIPHLELNDGAFYPEGGMISIKNALVALAKKMGVEIFCNSPVDRIIHHAGKIKGVVVSGMNILADIVVSNADIYFTYKNLLLDKKKAKRLLRQERSSSGIIFYWGIKKEFSQLYLHNIFFSNDYREEFNCLFKKGIIFNDPTVYINITSKMEAGHSPAGCENWFVLVNVPANTGQDWQAIKQAVKKNIISKLNTALKTDVEKLIEAEASLDPVSIESLTGSFMGSLYGTSSNSKMAAFLRHPNFSSPIKGLYFCGGSVHPGGGIPLCFKSAEITTNLIAKEYFSLTRN